MDDYISREALIEHLDKCKNDPLFDPDMARICFAISIFVENMKAADVQLVISGDNCIVCGRDVRKDNVYYDVNGGTICESCMNTKCKCKNGR